MLSVVVVDRFFGDVRLERVAGVGQFRKNVVRLGVHASLNKNKEIWLKI